MGHKTKGGFWCDWCGRPVAGEKGTHRARGAAGVLGAGLTGGLSLAASVPGRYHCPNCGNPVRTARTSDYEALQRAQMEAEQAGALVEPGLIAPSQPSIGAGDRAEPDEDWKDVPLEQVPPWRRPDRERLDAERAAEEEAAGQTAAEQPLSATPLADQLRQLADLHDAGALTDEEFAAAKQRLLGP